MNESEAVAAYIGVIRHELQLRPGADALVELHARLTPADVNARPPARAPGVVRLRKTLRELRERTPPAETLEQLVEDLRFLRLFEDDSRAWGPKALEALLTNVMAASVRGERTAIEPTGNDTPARGPAPIIPLRRKRPKDHA